MFYQLIKLILKLLPKLKTGIELSLNENTNLIAPKNSLVVYADFLKGYGNMVIDLINSYHLIISGFANIKCKTEIGLKKA